MKCCLRQCGLKVTLYFYCCLLEYRKLWESFWNEFASAKFPNANICTYPISAGRLSVFAVTGKSMTVYAVLQNP